MKKRSELVAVRLEPAIRKRFQAYCEQNETSMSQELRRSVKQRLGIIKQAAPVVGNTEC